MSLIKKVKRKVKDSLHIPSRNRSPDPRSSPSPGDLTPSQLSAAPSSISILFPGSTPDDSPILAAVPPASTTAPSYATSSAAHPSAASAQTPTAVPIIAISEERSGGSATWTGLKRFMGLLDRSADVFGPLRSAVDGIMTCVEIYERVGQGREEYESLREELNSLFEELSQYFGESTSPGITSSFHNLAM